VTTIIASREWMAADQRATDGGDPLCHVKKLHYIGTSIFGLAGDCHAGMAVIEWLQTPKRNRAHLYKMFGEDVAWRYEMILLELSHEGLALWNAWGVRLPILDETYAIGTGAHAALAALDRGATPEECVMQATKRDQYSGIFHEPEVLHLLPKRKRG
jgi:hypothetical protein